MGLCSQGALQHILLLETTKEQWDALKALYSPLGLQQLDAKTQAFISYTPTTEHMGIAEIANNLTTLQTEIGLISTPERPTDSLKISVFFRVIRAVDNRFEPLILQLEVSKSTTDFNAIVAHLTEAERCIGTKDPLKETVFSAQALENKPNQRPNQGGPRGSQGRPTGHFQDNCYNCRKPGHKSAECRGPRKPTGPSTRPLATPGGRRGLSPTPDSAMEASWVATTGPVEPKVTEASTQWIIDSGASRHMTYNRDYFSDYTLLQEPVLIKTASGATLQGIGQGTVPLRVILHSAERTVALTEVLHVPGLAGSLVSVLQLQDRGITVQTTVIQGSQLLIELQGTVIGIARRLGKAYILEGTAIRGFSVDTSFKATVQGSKRAPERASEGASEGALEAGPETALEEPTNLL
jgi:hypothetical protein